MRSSTFLKILFWSAAIILSGWMLNQLPFAAISQRISDLTLVQWFAWISLNLIIILLATQRWAVLSKAVQLPISFTRLLIIRQAGQAINFITPGPHIGGEPLQLLWMCKQDNLPPSKAILSLGLDRFYEMWINFSVQLLGVVLLLMYPISTTLPLNKIITSLLAVVTLFVLVVYIFWILCRHPTTLSGKKWLPEKLQHRLVNNRLMILLQKFNQHWQSFKENFRELLRTGKSALLMAIFLSLLGWAALIAELGLILSFIDVQLGVSAFILLFIGMRIALLLPMPGGVGPLEASVLWSFHALNLPISEAIGLIALMRLRDAVVLLAGLSCLTAIQTRHRVSEKSA